MRSIHLLLEVAAMGIDRWAVGLRATPEDREAQEDTNWH